MAKTGFWLKGAKGKLAGTTIYQQNGETVMREIVKPSNPKTTSQVLQRIIMHTIMGAYSLMKKICDHSFEGVKRGQDSMSYFMKQNVQFCREKIATMQLEGASSYEMYNFAPLGKKGFTPNQYQVAMGSLPRIDASIVNDESLLAYISGFSANTYADVIATLGLRRGDQLTFCLVSPTGNEYGQAAFHIARVILDPTNVDGTPADLSVAFVGENGKINLPSIRNEGNFYFTFNEAKQVTFGIRQGFGGLASFVIASRKGSNDQWLRSTTYVTYVEGANVAYSLGECLDLAESGSNPIYTANSQYLNNAGENTSAGAVVPVDPSVDPTAPAITGITARGTQLVSGTTRDIVFANGTQFPQEITVVVNASNADGRGIVVLDGSNAVAFNTIENGTAIMDVEVSKNKTYRVSWNDDGVYSTTAYSFSVSENPVPGGGGNEEDSDEG